MALVCDIKSDKSPEDDPDIEDGEITDDDEEPTLEKPPPVPEPNPATAGAQPTVPVIQKSLGNVSDSDSVGTLSREVGETDSTEKSSDRERSDEKDKFSDGRERDRTRNKEGRKGRDKPIREDKAHRHMTEAEKSILHLRKREKMLREREKWDKQHKKIDIYPLDDDFAKNIEKTLATILNKKEKEVAALGAAGEDVKEEEKRGKKRKKEGRDKDKLKNKHKRMMESPRSEIDENEMLNVRSGSPGAEMRLRLSTDSYGIPADHRRSRSPSRSEESYNNSEYSSDEKEERARRRLNKHRRKKENKRERRERRANREEQAKVPLQDSQGVCVFYMQGKCQKNDCPYSHEVSPPMKLELCKFYLMDCCAKGENCSYMHSEFPCKFYHTGLQCKEGKDCKFAHGRPLSEGLKQILFKHIETAPRDILQGFPRLSRDEALNLINQTQKKLTDQVGNSAADQNTSSSSTSLSGATHNIPTTHGGGQSSSVSGLGMYREDYDTSESRDNGERDKEGAKGGIPSLFDITVPVPRELAHGADFETKITKNERSRNKNSRWQQDRDPKLEAAYPVKNFTYGTDQDMRITSNGDIDMRTLPSISTNSSDKTRDSDSYQREDTDIRSLSQDVDIRRAPFTRNMSNTMDLDIRQNKPSDTEKDLKQDAQEDEDNGSQDGGETNFELPPAARDLLARITANQKDNTVDTPSVTESQSGNTIETENYDNQNINWYSDDDDDDDNRLTIRVEEEEIQKREREDSASERELSNQEDNNSNEPFKSSFLSPPQFNSKTADIVGKLGDLSKIDISAEVTKLLTSMSQNKNQPAGRDNTTDEAPSSTDKAGTSKNEDAAHSDVPTDPRMTRQHSRIDPRQDPRQLDPRQDPRLSDPRQRVRQNSTETKEKEKKSDKVSIYEQGGIDMKKAALEIDSEDFKSSLRPDIDLRSLSLPFKGMQNYTPATEIDASVNSHAPMAWKVIIVEIPRPDYTGLKLSINDAEKTGDPRLRKIFRLSVDEKDSPASPKASPKQGGSARVDPRLRKIEEKVLDPKESQQMSYNQQLSMLQSSQFYQSLTSNQKLMLNQELAKSDPSGGGGLHDPVLNTLLSSLNLLPQGPTNQTQVPMGPNAHMGTAVSILSNINKINSMMPNQPLIGQQGLLGAAPGIPNLPPNLPPGMPPDYPMNFDPRGGGGLLGNAPPGGGFNQFGGMDQPPFGGGYNDDFYGGGYDDPGNMGPPPGGNMQGGNFRPGRGYNNNNRDGRRRGHRDGFRGGRGNNRNFHKRGGGRDKGDRGDRRDRDQGRSNRGHSPS